MQIKYIKHNNMPCMRRLLTVLLWYYYNQDTQSALFSSITALPNKAFVPSYNKIIPALAEEVLVLLWQPLMLLHISTYIYIYIYICICMCRSALRKGVALKGLNRQKWNVCGFNHEHVQRCWIKYQTAHKCVTLLYKPPSYRTAVHINKILI